MAYEDVLIREATEPQPQYWCSACERDADECVCEELSDWFREVESGTADVCVPAVVSDRGLEAEPYTHEESEARRKEQAE